MYVCNRGRLGLRLRQGGRARGKSDDLRCNLHPVDIATQDAKLYGYVRTRKGVG